MTTTRATATSPAGGIPDRGWQQLARLSTQLVGLPDETAILRVALGGVADILRCDTAEIVLHPVGDSSGLVARVQTGVEGGRVQVSEPSAAASVGLSRDGGLTVPLPGSAEPIGTLGLSQRGLFGRPDKRLAFAFALLVSSAVAALRTLETERQVVEDTYQRAMVDRLTSLGSRSLLTERGDQSLSSAKAKGRTAALLLFDVDDFKRINDTLGHHAGDRVLAEFGSRLRRAVRDGDLAVRLGGDEFAVLTGQLKSPEDAELLATRLLRELAPPITVDDVELAVRSSVGIAVHEEDGDSLDELLRAADLAMYAAKGLGSGRWQRYSPSSQALAERWSTLAEDLRGGSLDEQLVLHYQPQVDAWSGQVTGFESLVRWDHHQLGLLSPGEFVPLAERAGLMSRLTSSVLTRALRDYPTLQQIAPGSSVSVNISARNLLGRGLVSDVARLLAEHGVPAEHLTLEVTEPAPGISPGVTETLTGLVELGCRVSVSEFGTGSSSLMALSRYEGIRELKLDSGLVSNILGDPAAERLARAIIGTAHALDVRVVAEGVESREIVTHLRDLGCDVLQGYYVRPPAVIDEIRHWIDGWPMQREDRLAVTVQELS